MTSDYRQLKEERGLLDFADLEQRAIHLLRNVPLVKEILQKELDLLVVDEFQDTSPIQLGLFMELVGCAKETIWVWFEASQAIKHAHKIICMGYSLPMSDLTMAQFLKSSAPIRRIPFELIDITSKCEHFRSVISGEVYDFIQENADEDCIPKFVVKNCIPDEENMQYVIQMTPWKRAARVINVEDEIK